LPATPSIGDLSFKAHSESHWSSAKLYRGCSCPAEALIERFSGRMERFVGRQNIEHFRATLKIPTGPGQRKVLEKLLLEAEAKLKKDEEDHKTK